MKLLLERDPSGLTCTIGHITIDGRPFCDSLELLWRDNEHNVSCIPPGIYGIALTVSDRARRGELWTPSAKFWLPEILGVPDRTAIRMHAANTSRDVKGCIGVGTWRGGEAIDNSRSALTSLIDMLEISDLSRMPKTTIEIRNPA